MPKFNQYHIETLLDFSESTKKFHLLSATKQKRVLELIQCGLMRQDEEDFIFTTETGNNLIDAWTAQLNSMFS